MSASGVIDIHAHNVMPDALTEIARVAPRYAPVLRRADADWMIDIPPGVVKKFPDGTSLMIPAGLVDVTTRLAEMDEQGVQVHALRNYTPLNFYTLEAEVAAQFHSIHNDAVISMARSAPDRFVALPSLPMQDAALAAQEVRRLAMFPEVVGLGIGSNVAGGELDDERLEPLWDAINEAGLPVLVHPPGGVVGADRLRAYHLVNLIGNPAESTAAVARIIFSGILDRYPNLRFLFVHGGGFAPYQIGRWDHGWRVRDEAKQHISRPPSEYLRERCYFDSLTHDPTALRFLGEQVGWDHVLLGTDYPWDMGTTTPIADLKKAGLDESRWQSVTTGNAMEFLRWPGRVG